MQSRQEGGSLNPYCSGRWSRTFELKSHQAMLDASLNPYCSGRWSRTSKQMTKEQALKVLILIVVEDGLVPNFTMKNSSSSTVLILIVVEDGLVPHYLLI